MRALDSLGNLSSKVSIVVEMVLSVAGGVGEIVGGVGVVIA